MNRHPNHCACPRCGSRLPQDPTEMLEAAAIGVPHEVSGEVVKLFIVRKDDSLTAEAVIAHCRSHLTGYKVPKHVEFKEELPKTNVGKILRRDLRN